jgi:hypothetical protein
LSLRINISKRKLEDPYDLGPKEKRTSDLLETPHIFPLLRQPFLLGCWN